MERGLDVPEQSQGDAAAGAQPAPVDPGAADAPVEAAAPDQTEEAAPDAVAEAAAEEAAGVEAAAPADADAAEVEAAVVAAAAEDSAAAAATDADPAPAAAPVAAERTADGPAEAAAPADPVVAATRADDEPVPVTGPPRKRTLTGNVVSDKGDRTIVVSIARRKKHSLYKKYITLTRKLKAHDPDNECQVGDLVRVVESRPLSKEKRWRLVEIVKRAG